MYFELEPYNVNRGPFSLFAVIDGHRGCVVAEYIKNHLMEVVYRNKNIMVKRFFAKGLKEVFIKMEELLTTEHAQAEMARRMYFPGKEDRKLISKEPELPGKPRCRSPEWDVGAALTIVITTSDEIYCAQAGDCRVVISSDKKLAQF